MRHQAAAATWDREQAELMLRLAKLGPNSSPEQDGRAG